ncbi:hypothetical protein LCGC14_2131320 [marine sediment metagenome]|uniref:Uncharacterized protein n=1 Tax=marine sediment metagenome TaxID=412755 RepID=A0A0F9ENI7_9ZZZZ
MDTLDAQSENTQHARVAIVGLLSRGAYIRASKTRGRGWGGFHLVINGQRHEANKEVLRGIAESGKATITDDHDEDFVCFTAPNLRIKGRFYAYESC